MRSSKKLFNKYFIISVLTHLAVISLLIFLVYEADTDSVTSSVEIGLIESPSAEKASEDEIKPKSPKVVTKQTSQNTQNHVINRNKKNVKNSTDQLSPSSNQSKSSEPVQKPDENISAKSSPRPSSYKPENNKQKSRLILAQPDYRYNPKPKYPMAAKRRGYEGTVLLNVYVLDSGRVGELNLEKPSGFAMLDESAIESVKEWIFVPGKRNGVAVSSWVQVPIMFRLTNI